MISIITSLFNSEIYIKRYSKHLLRVIKYLNKRQVNYEVIIITNYPSKEEKTELYRLNSLIKNCKIIEVERETLYTSWNRGIKVSKGNAITFWNVDDIRFGKAIIKGERLIKKGADIIYFSFIMIWKHKYFRYLPIYRIAIIKPPRFSIQRNEEGMIGGPFFMFNSKILENVGYFDEQFKVVGDYDWFIRAGRKGIKFLSSFLLAGLYIKQGTALSGGSNNCIHKVENQVLYRRFNLRDKLEKLTSEEKEILKMYKI